MSTRLFDIWSRFYDQPAVQRAIYKPVQDAVVDALPRGTTRVVDVGCGTGQLAARLADERPAARVTGCDFSFGMLEQAGARGADVLLVQADALHLPLADASFDAVTSTEAFHWFPDQVAALREFRRVLAPGGLVLVAVTAPVRPVRRAGRIFTLIGGPRARWQSRTELRQLMQAAGLRLREQRRISRVPGGVLLPPVLTVGERPATPAR